MIRRHAYLAVLLFAILGLLTACSKKPDDEMIVKDIQDKVAMDPDTKDSSLQVSSTDGKVTLKGTTPSPAAQQKADQIAKAEPGVSSVSDETAVVAPPPPMAENPAPAPEPMAAAPRAAPAPMPAEKPRPKPQPVVIPSGTSLTVKLGQSLSSKTSQTGQNFTATLAQPVSVGGRTVIPAGSMASGTILNAKERGRFKGEGELSLALQTVTIKGHTYNIETGPLDSTVKGKGKRTAVTTGGGAAGGALIGGIAGGGKGAGIGALVGAGAGLLGGAFTGNKQVEIPAESALTFRLSAPLTLPPGTE